MKKYIFGTLLSVIMIVLFSGCAGGGSGNLPFNTNSALLADDGTIDVIWNEAPDADSFEIYRSSAEDGEYALIGTAEGGKTIFNDADVKPHETYWYKVRYESGGEMSEFSDVVAAYVSDGPKYNRDMTFEIKFPEGDTVIAESGLGALGSNTYELTITPLLNGEPISDCTVYYDKASMDVTPSDAGSFDFKFLEAGQLIITFSSGDETGTFEYALAKMPDFDNEYFMAYFNQFNEEVGLNDYFYPNARDSLLYIRHDGSYVSEIEAKSSNTNIAEVSSSGGNVYVTNKSPGICKITISDSDNKSEITWVVKRGRALDQPAVNGVPISANIDPAKAEEVIQTVTSPDYSEDEIQSMADSNLSPKEWQDKLSKPADVMCMLRTLNFNNENTAGEEPWIEGPEYGGYSWSRKPSPTENFKLKQMACQQTSEMMNYLLRGDMEEQGYVAFEDPAGGHSLCYYKMNGLYVFCDFVDSIPDKEIPNEFYVKYVCDNLNDYSDFYVGDMEKNDPKAGWYMYYLYMYPMEARQFPGVDTGEYYSVPGCGVASVYPEEWHGKKMEDIVTVLYKVPEFEPKFVPGPPESEYPD